MKLFEEASFTDTEMDIIKANLGNSVVVRYLRSLAQQAAIDLALGSDRLREPSHEYQVKNAFLHGSVATIMDIVDIATTPVI